MKAPPASRLLEIGILIIVPLAFAAYYLTRELAIAGSPGLPLDDAWIHLVFARNFARGDFFSFNSHVPVAGSTSPLWAMILGAGYALTQSPVWMPKVLGVVLNIALGLLTWRFVLFLGLHRFPALVVALLVVCAPRLVWASMSGMEVGLYVLLCVASIYAYLKWTSPGSWKFYISWGIAGLAVWARPELMTLPLMFVVHQLLLRRRVVTAKRNAVVTMPAEEAIIPWPAMIRGVGVSLIGFILFVVLNEQLSGVMMPLTFSIKAGKFGMHALLAEGKFVELANRAFLSLFEGTWNAVRWMWMQDNVFLAIVAVAGSWMVVTSQFGKRRAAPQRSAIVLLATVLLLFPPIRGFVAGSYEFAQWGRYAAQLTPLMIVFAAILMCDWMERRAPDARELRRGMIGVAAVSTLILAVYYLLQRALGSGHDPVRGWDMKFLHAAEPVHVAMFAGWAVMISLIALLVMRKNSSLALAQGFVLLLLFGFCVVENVQAADENAWNVRNVNDTQENIGRWLTTSLPRGGTFATMDIGAMGYFAEQDTVIDVMGLVQPEVADWILQTKSADLATFWVLERWHPTYLVFYTGYLHNLYVQGIQSGALELTRTVPTLNNITCGTPFAKEMVVCTVHPEKFESLKSQSGH